VSGYEHAAAFVVRIRFPCTFVRRVPGLYDTFSIPYVIYLL
jgi:hypothetical protein